MADARPPLVPQMMAATLLRVWLMVWAGLTLARGSPSTSPNSAVMPSVSYLDLPFGWNRSSLEKDIAAVFNKVAYGSSTMPSVIVSQTPVVTSPSPPPTMLLSTSTSTTQPPPTPATLHIETPEYTSRTRFKPPLPPEYTNPFADKPILRGSQSEHSTGGHRPLPPPPRPPRPPPEQERIPIRPPDLLVPQDRNKKPLNTPARGTVRPQQAVTYAQETVRLEPRNDTEFDFVPILQNPTVTRILSGSSGRKVEDDIRNLTSRVHLEHINKELIIAPTPPPTSSPAPAVTPTEHVLLSDDTKEHEEEVSTSELPLEELESQQQEDQEEEQESEPADFHHQSQEPHWDSRVWGVAWDIHVYLMGSLFALLALVAIVNFIRTYKRLLPKGYFVILNGILLIIGVFRSIFLFFDAYNLGETYPAVISPLLLNFVFPCLTSAFTVLFLFLVQTAKVQVVSPRLQNAPVVGVITLSHLLLCLSLDLVAGFLLAKFLLLVCQAVFLIWGVTLAVSYLFVFGALSRAALRQQCDFLRAPFSKLATLPPQNPALGLAVRALLATAMLMLLLAAVQLYGVFGVYGVLSDEPPRPWPWWGLQFSVRVIEVSMCFLMVFVATLRNSLDDGGTSVFSLFSCNTCAPQEENKPTDDLYPAICSTNQAIHNYSMHTGKKVYEDSFPLSNMPLGEPIIPVAVRLSMKRSSSRSDGHHSPSSSDSQRPSSMLFAEDGFVRFRTSADPEQPMEEVLHQSLNRPDPIVTAFHLPSEEFCLEQQTKVRYRPAGEPAQHIYQGECRGGRHDMWHLSPAHLRHHPSESSADSDLVSDEEPSSSCQDITPDSAVGSDIYSKNGEIPVENSKYWCEELVSRLRGSNFSLHGYTPLDKHAMHACKLEALYNSRPQHESAV